MADLATVDELATLLRLSESQAEAADELLTLLLDGAENLFEAECRRTEIPFAAAATGRVEILEARRSHRLWLDYPIADVTAITLGVDVDDPENTTLDPDDATVVVWRVGQRTLTRTDGGRWTVSCSPQRPSFVKVTYNTGEDLPEDAKTAVLRLAAALYGELGTRTRGLASETLDNYSATYVNQTTFADAARKDPAWAIAVNNHRRLTAD